MRFALATFLAGAVGMGCLYGQQSTTIALTSSINPSVFGQPVTLTATVTPAAATGKVTFYEGATVLGTKTLVAGQAVLSPSLSVSGARSLKAFYGGSSGYTPSTSPALAQTVNSTVANGFLSPVQYSVLSLKGTMAQGDFNGDGNADLVTAGGISLNIMLGNGDGTFQPSRVVFVDYSLVQPYSVAVGDFNGDGKADLVVSNSPGFDLMIFLGNGDGTFQYPIYFDFSTNPQFIVVGDFNGDGKADLAVADLNNGLAVVLGKGDGAFQPAVNYPTVNSPRTVAVGDFNGDGKTDLAIATANDVEILLGNGDGTFRTPPLVYLAGQNPDAVAVGDLDGDGKQDLVIADNSTGNNVNVLLGNGDGTFRPAANYPTDLTALWVALADVDGDGKLDVVVANGSDSSYGKISVLLGNGDGTLRTAISYSLARFVQWLVVGDFNGDGRVDVAVGDSNVGVFLGTVVPTAAISLSSTPNPSRFGANVSLTALLSPPAADGVVSFYDGATLLGSTLLENGKATFTIGSLSPGSHSLKAHYGGSSYYLAADSTVVAQTVSGVVVATTTTLASSLNPTNFGQNVTLTATVSPSTATGPVTFYDGTSVLGTTAVVNGRASLATTLLGFGSRLLSAHYRGDASDLPSSSAVVSQAVRSVPANGFRTFRYGFSASAESIAQADLNGDGKADLVVAGNRIDIFLNNGDGTFQSPISTNASNGIIIAMVVGDFNNDGKTDLAVASSPGPLSILFGNGDGTFQTPVNYAGSFAKSMVVGDFNGDGSADLAIIENGSGVAVFLNNGDGTFQAPVTYTTGDIPDSVATGDFNGDGKVDLVVANVLGGSDSQGTVSILLGNGDGTFQPAMNSHGVVHPGYVIVGDFNGDGKADIAVASGDSPAALNVFLGNGDGTFQAPLTSTVSDYTEALAIGDLDGDGKLDIIVASQTDPTGLSVLLGNGNGTFGPPATYSTGFWYALVVGDFNNDGRSDIAAASTGIGTIVLLGATATQLNFTTQPVNTIAGAAIPSVVVQEQDAARNAVIMRIPPNVTVASSPAGFNSTVPPEYGVATFSNLLFNTPGTYSLTATATGLSGATSTSFVVSSPIPTQLAFTAPPHDGLVGTAISPVVIQLQDAGSRLVNTSSASVTLASSPAGISSTIAAVNGVATFTNLVFTTAGNYTLTASSSGLTSATTFSFAISQSGQTIIFSPLANIILGAAPFTLAATASSGLPVSFLSTTPSVCTVSATSVSLVATGTCSITATQSGNSNFAPAPSVTQTFTVTALISIGGKVTRSGAGLSGVTVVLTGSQSRSTITDPSGNYNFSGLNVSGSYTVTPSLNGYTFTPPSQAFNNPNLDQLANFTATPITYSISGRVNLATSGLGNVTVTLSGSQNNSALTDSSGNFSFGNLAAGGNYTITPSLAGYGFNPPSASITSLSGNQTVAFAASPLVVISGQVTIAGVGLGGVIINIAGIAPTTTDSSGNYSVTLPGNGTFAFSAYKLGYSFSAPSSITTTPGTNQIINLTAVAIGGLDFFPVAPCRIADTRAGAGFTGQFGPPAMAGPSIRIFNILSSPCAANIPLNVAAYSLNFTVAPPSGGPAANLTTWPAGMPNVPSVSTLNFAGSVVANAAIVPAGTGGAIGVFVNYPTDVLFDINGYFAPPAPSGLTFFPVTPCRIADTRNGAGFTGQFGPPGIAGGAIRNFNIPASACGIPATASAYSLNFTVVPPGGGPSANLTTWPAGSSTIPNVSTLNFSGSVVANAALVPAGANGAINVFVNDPSDVLFDTNGYFVQGPPSGLHFYPVTPCRIADTRNGAGFAGPFGPPAMLSGSTRIFNIPAGACAIPANASAYSLNFTVVPPAGGPAANLTTWPVGAAMPNVSTLNYYGSVVANAAIVPAGANGAINVYVNFTTDVLFDINGYFAP